MIYDLIIIGGGPAGTSAGVYAARKELKTLLIAGEFGGQSSVSTGIQNWIGTVEIAGSELGVTFEKHLRAYARDFLTINKGELVSSIKKDNDIFTVTTDKGIYTSKTVLIATGSTRRRLEAPGADTFEHKGLTYCASCDGPVFSGMDVAVIGGGNAAFESAAQLLAYCKSVTLIIRGESFRADEITVEKVLANPNMKVIKNAEITEVYGDKFVKGMRYKDKTSGQIIDLPLSGIFVEIGLIPSTSFAKGAVNMNEYGQILIDPRTQKTSTTGIWAAGDCTDVLYHQNNISAGDGVKALEDIYVTLKTR